jgi:hypothetical protein
MGCRVSYCIGGGCVPTATDPAQWLQAFGYQYNASDPLDSVYSDIIATMSPSTIDNASFDALAEACMRSRAILFCNQNPGDSGSTQAQAVSSSTLEAENSAETAASLIPVPGVSQVLSLVLSVFTAHAQAEKAQANALSTLTPQITEAIRRADASVYSGASTPDQAIAFLQQTMIQAQQSWASLTKNCNAFCWYNAILQMMVTVSEHYYAITPTLASLEQSNEENIAPTIYNVPSNGTTTVGGTSSVEATLQETVGGIKVETILLGLAFLLGIGALLHLRGR